MNFKQILLSDWHLRRWLALFAGMFFAIQAISHSDMLTGMLSFVILFQAITNTGCFGSKSCSVPITASEEDVEGSEITYTTVK